jgi:Rrf2 family transcriptional regulator, nitric oxide-sensitive transcriptional repressor
MQQYRNRLKDDRMSLAMHTDYALRTLLYLGAKKERATVDEVAKFYGISLNHLGKVVHRLGRLGFAKNVRGPGGGIELAVKPGEISVGAVVRAFEGREVHFLECIETPGVCVIQAGCKLRGVLAEAERRQMEYLNGVTLADLLPLKAGVLELKVS